MASPLGFLAWCHRTFGDIFSINTLLMGPEVAVVDPALVKPVFTADPETARAGEANAVLEPLIGPRSVLLLDGAEHLRHRRLMMPPFHGERMTAYARTMREAAERAIDAFPEREPFRLHPYMQRVTLEVILRTVFGMAEGPRRDELRDALTHLLDRQSGTLAAVTSMPLLRRTLFGLGPWDRFLRDRKRADDLLFAQIARRRAEKEPGQDILGMLLEARDEEGRPLTDSELRDELMTLLVAGHETTATMLCWAFELILGSPRVEAILRAEVAAAGPEQTGKLDYLDAVIKETLRLYPVIPAVGRRLHAPMDLGGYHLPSGTLVVPAIALTHRHPSVYPRPSVFEPERFLDKKVDPYAYYPFGGGTRRCLGMAFAQLEMKIVIATLLARVRLRKRRPEPERVTVRGISFAPERGVEVMRMQRSRAEASP
jgi:cytochrome P450